MERERKRIWNTFIEGHENRVQHSVGMHKHISEKNEIWGCCCCNGCCCSSGQQRFTFIAIERAKKKQQQNSKKTESKSKKKQCLKQHVEGEINK